MTRHVRFTLLAVLTAMTAAVAAQQQIKPSVPLQLNSPITTNSVPSDQTKVSTDARRLELADAYAKLPLSFEFNHGQTDGSIRFLSRGPGYSLFLTPTEAVLALRGLAKPGEVRPQATRRAATTVARPSARTDVLQMKLLGSNPEPSATALEELPGKSNYFIGNDPKQWRTNVPNYGKVRFGGVYPGVDLVYYGNLSQLEYDFVVAPGADPLAIRLGFAGAEQMQIDSQGQLTLQMRTGEVRWHKPIAYQEIDGVRHIVGSQYVRKGKETVGFEVASYDPRHALIIDPTLDYSTYLGGSASTTSTGIAVDSSGNAYVTGYTLSINNIASVGAYQGTLAGGQDAFVTKIDTTRFGSASRVYSTYLGGSGTDAGLGIAVDSSGNAYITGDTGSLNFPTYHAYQAAFQGGPGGLDAFVTKLNSAGNGLLYSTYLGGNQNDVGHGIAVDSSNPPNGYAYVTGDAISSNFPTLNGFQNSGYGFVTKLNTLLNGVSSLVYSTYMDSDARAIAADSTGNVYVTGIFGGGGGLSALCLVSYCNGSGVPIPRSDKNAFVMKVNTNASGLSSLVYYTYVGGGNDDVGSAIAVDSSGNAYVTGTTSSVDFVGTITSLVSPKVNSIQSTNGGGNDAFVFKLNASGDGLLYSTYLGGTGDDEGFGIAVDPLLGNAFVTGLTSSTDGTFPTWNALDGQSSPPGGPNNAFVTKINASGTAWLYSTYLGGSGGDFATGIALDSSRNAYITGTTTSSNFPVASAFQFSPGGTPGVTSNAFVARISDPVPTVTNVTSTAPNGSYGTGASIDIEITFSDVINVTGTPELALNSGGIASYSSGSGTNTLTFTYVVGAGQNSSHLDYTSTTALTLNGGTIEDSTANPADLTLPTPGAAGSLGANTSIEIDTVAPTVISYSVVFGANTFNLIGSTRSRLPWQITGIRAVFSKPIASADINSLSGVSTTGLSGLGTNTLTWSISPITLGSISTMLVGSGSDAIKDASGNALGGGAGYAQNFKVLQGDFNDDGFVASNDMLAVWNATAQAYNIFADINGDGVVNLTDVQIVRSRIGTSLP